MKEGTAMDIVINISEDVYTRLFDNGTDTSLEDRKVIDKAIRIGERRRMNE